MELFLIISGGIGILFAFALSCAAIITARRRYASHKLTRAVVGLQADVVDLTERITHVTGLFKKMSARVGQRERRAEEKTAPPIASDGRDLTGEEWKRNYRREHAHEFSLNKRG